MSLSTFEEGTKCSEEYEAINDDEKMQKNNRIEEATFENKGESFCSGSEADSDLEEAKNASSEKKKNHSEEAIKIKENDSEEDSDIEEIKNVPPKPEKNVKEEEIERKEKMLCSGSEKDSDLEEITPHVSEAQSHDKGEGIEIKKDSILLDNIGSNQNSNNNSSMSQEKIIKQEIFVDNKKKFNFQSKRKSSSSEKHQEKSIKFNNRNESRDSKSKEKVNLRKLRPSRMSKSNYYSDKSYKAHIQKEEVFSIVISSDSDDDVKPVKEEKEKEEEEKKEDNIKSIDKSFFPLFLLKEAEILAQEKLKRKLLERKEENRRIREERRRIREEEDPVELNVAGLRQRKQVKYYESSSEEEEEEALEKDEKDAAGSENVDGDSDFDPDEYDENSSQKEDKGVQKKTDKSDASSENNNDMDSDFDPEDSDENSSEVKGSRKKTESSSTNKKTTRMTDYEKMLEDKRNKNLEMLKSIGILEAKNEFFEAVSSGRKKRTRQKVDRPIEPAVKRESKRRKTQIDYAEESITVHYNALNEKYNPNSTPFKKALHINNMYKNFAKDFSEIVEETLIEDCAEKKPVFYDKKVLKELSPDYIASKGCFRLLSWYPSADNLVLSLSGGIGGTLSLWNIDESDLKFYTFSVHHAAITGMQFNPYVPSHLISTSRDGTLMVGDLNKLMFTKILDISRDITSFDFFSPHTYLASLRTGEIVIVDGRAENEGHHKRHTCHQYEVNTVNTHPLMKSFFVTAGREGNVYIWDLRRLTNEPVLQITSHQREVYSAYFSPVTGKSLLTTSFDDTIRIFDCSSKTQKDLNTSKNMKFKPHKFAKRRAIWLPNSDDTFSFPEDHLNVYDKNLRIYETIEDGVKWFRNSYAFNPFKKALASGTVQRCYVST